MDKIFCRENWLDSDEKCWIKVEEVKENLKITRMCVEKRKQMRFPGELLINFQIMSDLGLENCTCR